MKRSALKQIRDLLPELYDPDATGNMCSPESGCSTAQSGSEMDIVNRLTESYQTPNAQLMKPCSRAVPSTPSISKRASDEEPARAKTSK